jgi:hypothetical protein
MKFYVSYNFPWQWQRAGNSSSISKGLINSFVIQKLLQGNAC